ncbi:hypothetical protein D3C72_1280170 [compost metagenome]
MAQARWKTKNGKGTFKLRVTSGKLQVKGGMRNFAVWCLQPVAASQNRVTRNGLREAGRLAAKQVFGSEYL